MDFEGCVTKCVTSQIFRSNKKNVSEVEREKIKKMHGMKYNKNIYKE